MLALSVYRASPQVGTSVAVLAIIAINLANVDTPDEFVDLVNLDAKTCLMGPDVTNTAPCIYGMVVGKCNFPSPAPMHCPCPRVLSACSTLNSCICSSGGFSIALVVVIGLLQVREAACAAMYRMEYLLDARW